MEEFKKYESVCILKENIGVKALDQFGIEVKDILKEANITKIDDIGFKKLAYEIKGNKKGYYILLEFTTTEKQVAELEKYYRLNDDIIKFITVSF